MSLAQRFEFLTTTKHLANIDFSIIEKQTSPASGGIVLMMHNLSTDEVFELR